MGSFDRQSARFPPALVYRLLVRLVAPTDFTRVTKSLRLPPPTPPTQSARSREQTGKGGGERGTSPPSLWEAESATFGGQKEAERRTTSTQTASGERQRPLRRPLSTISV